MPLQSQHFYHKMGDRVGILGSCGQARLAHTAENINEKPVAKKVEDRDS